MIRPNSYPGRCHRCGTFHLPGAAIIVRGDGRWLTQCSVTCELKDWKAAEAAAPKPKVGDLSALLAFFDAARVKAPAVVVLMSERHDGPAIRVNVATQRAKVPGSLTIAEYIEGGSALRRGLWFGRVLRDGTFQPTRDCRGVYSVEAITERLVGLASNPERVAAEYGKLTGYCCFCSRRLDDPRSGLVGYGPSCAKSYGLPWGTKAAKAGTSAAA